MYTLLFVDDEPEILDMNRQYFEAHGFAVDTAESASKAINCFMAQDYHCIILDIQMKSMDGYQLCQYVKERSAVPVIFLTNLTEDECLEKGFIVGGDDYMVKPYKLRELELRIYARIRSAQETAPGDIIVLGKLTIDNRKKQAFLFHHSLRLTLNEFLILQFLASHRGIAFTQEAIYQEIFGVTGYYKSHSIQTLIVRIRKKLASLDPKTQYILTEWGKGYLFA